MSDAPPSLPNTTIIMALLTSAHDDRRFVNNMVDLHEAIESDALQLLTIHLKEGRVVERGCEAIHELAQLRGNLLAYAIARTTRGPGITYAVHAPLFKRLLYALGTAKKLNNYSFLASSIMDLTDALSANQILSLEDRIAFDPVRYLQFVGEDDPDNVDCGDALVKLVKMLLE